MSNNQSKNRHALIGKKILGTLMFLILCQISFGQKKELTSPKDSSEQISAQYFIDVQKVPQGKKYEIKDSVLRLLINEPYVKKGKADIQILNWKRETIATIKPDKKYGLNQYAIKLDSLHKGWKTGEYYTVEYTGEKKKKQSFSFQLSEPKKEPIAKPDISINPIFINCKEKKEDVNLVEYTGKIKGGVAPYDITWLVSTDSKGENLLYEPLTAKVEEGDQAPKITVKKPLGYYVILKIKDACRQEQEQITRISCEIKKSEKIINLELNDQKKKSPGKI